GIDDTGCRYQQRRALRLNAPGATAVPGYRFEPAQPSVPRSFAVPEHLPAAATRRCQQWLGDGAGRELTIQVHDQQAIAVVRVEPADDEAVFAQCRAVDGIDVLSRDHRIARAQTQQFAMQSQGGGVALA